MEEKLQFKGTQDKYLIINHIHKYGHTERLVNKDKVREVCEEYKKRAILTKEFNKGTYIRIEVCNTDTGEIREYWNSGQKEVLF